MFTDVYERADDGFEYNPHSDYYHTYSEDVDECDVKSQHGVYNLMVRVVDDGDRAISKFDINLDSDCTRQMTPCFLSEQPTPCVVGIVVGNKEKLQYMHKGNMYMRLGNLVFIDVLFVPGLSVSHSWI